MKKLIRSKYILGILLASVSLGTGLHFFLRMIAGHGACLFYEYNSAILYTEFGLCMALGLTGIVAAVIGFIEAVKEK